MQTETPTPEEAYGRLKALYVRYHEKDDAARQCWIPDEITGEVAGEKAYAAAYAEFRAVLDEEDVPMLLARAAEARLSPRDARNLELMRYLHDIHVVERVHGGAYSAQHKRTSTIRSGDPSLSNWDKLRPEFAELVALARKRAEALGRQFGCSPYEALLREHDPDMTERNVDAWLGEFKEYALQALRDVVPGQRRIGPEGPAPLFARKVPQARQEAFVRDLLGDMGFDFDPARGLVLPYAFPNTNSAFGRTFLGIPYREEDPMVAASAATHEIGHGLFEQYPGPKHSGQPVDRINNNMPLQESQGTGWEYMIGHNPAFLDHLASRLRATYGDDSITGDALRERLHRLRPSPIRRGSDPISYGLHVVMRWEIERDLINGDLEVEALPERWRKDMKEYFGIEIAGPADGWMQDPQWYNGRFGYWPSYVVGMAYAATIYEQMRRDMPDLDDRLARGELHCIRDWLATNIFPHGQEIPGHELVGGFLDGRPIMAPLLTLMNARLGRTAPPILALAGR